VLEVFVNKETMFPPSSARGIGDEGDIFSVNTPLEPGDSGSLPFPPKFPFHGYSAAGAESSSSARSDIDIPSSRPFSFGRIAGFQGLRVRVEANGIITSNSRRSSIIIIIKYEKRIRYRSLRNSFFNVWNSWRILP
jgi:hypothetical protein